MYDGSIVIGTKLDTSKFDKQVTDLQNKIKKEEDKKIILETKIDYQEAQLQNAIDKTDELADAYQRFKALQEKVFMRKATPVDMETFQQLQKQYGTLEKIDDKFQRAVDKQSDLQIKIEQTKMQYEGVNQKVQEYKQKLNSINIEKQKKDVDGLKGSIDKVGSSFTGAVKKAGKLALAIFGIRSAWMLLRRASSELSGYDEQYAANLEYIRFVLTQAIAPVLRYIVNLAMQLLSWINAIAQAWFGVNLFANGSVEAFQKMKKGAGGVSKAVKEIKKQLLGFDEVNVLSSQSDTGTSAGAGGVSMPNFDVSGLQGEVPQWLQWIVDHKDEILPVLAGIAGAILALKLGLGGIAALGIGLVIAGIVLLIQGIIDFMKDPSWKNFMTILAGIALIVAGIAIACGAWVVALIAIGVAIVAYIIKNWDKVKEIFSKVGKWFYDKVIEPVKGFFIGLWSTFSMGAIGAWENIKNVFSTIGNWINDNIIQPVITFFKDLKEKIVNGVTTAIESVKTAFNNVKDWISENIIQPIGKFFTDLWEGFKNGANSAWEGIKTVFNTVAEYFKGIFTTAWENVKKVFSTGGKIFDGIKEGIVSSFKNIVNAIIRGINNVISVPFNAINNVLSRVSGIEIMGAKPFSFVHTVSVPKIPQLKSGGIINMPNRGTLLGGSAIGGEAGREGVVPLTDQQAMAELGREIGKNVLVNLTNITQMNGRVISRELKQVRSTQEFAYNM